MRPGLGQTSPVAVRYSERPELWERIVDLSAQIWPEYNLHGEVLNFYWGQLYEAFPDYQFVIYDVESDEVLAEGHAIPCYWDETLPGLGTGIDATVAAAFLLHGAGAPNALSALAAEIVPAHQGRGLSSVVSEKDAGDRKFGRLTEPHSPRSARLEGALSANSD